MSQQIQSALDADKANEGRLHCSMKSLYLALFVKHLDLHEKVGSSARSGHSTDYEGKRVKVTTYWDETIPNDLNDAPGALVTKIEPANSVST